MAEQSALNYSRTQRIVLLVDLSPLPHLHGHSTYLQSLLSSVRLLLSFPPLSESLFSYKLFFSALSPILSSSAVLKLLSRTTVQSSCKPNSLSFNRPVETLASLSETLNSILDPPEDVDFDSAVGKADFVASSMFQLVHDYSWEVQDLPGKSFDSGDLELSSGLVRSNMVVLFSPVCKSVLALRDYMGVNGEGDLTDLNLFRDRFIRTFGHVSSSFSMRDIHMCWVDMSYELECDVKEVQSDESRRIVKLFQHEVKNLGWGFCSTGSIVLGSALVPFGLIYPAIGVLSNYCDSHRVAGQLNLEILDVNGQPFQCNCCDFQFFGLKALQKMEHADLMRNWKSLQLRTESGGQSKDKWEFAGDDTVKIDIRSIHRYDVKKYEQYFYDVVLVRELSTESNRNAQKSTSEGVADKVLQILMKDTDSCTKRKFVPIWQILLSFLYRGGYWALVSISKSDGSSCMGVLKPFTTNSSLLYLIKDDDSDQIWERDSDKLNGRKPKDELEEHGMDENTPHSTPRDERKRKIRKHDQKSNDVSWSHFSKEALSCSSMVLEEAYFSMGGGTTKKLKFLKCWMKQVSKRNFRRHLTPLQPKQHPEKKEMVEDRVRVVQGESVQPFSFSCPQVEDLVPDTQQGTHALISESSESYFSSLPEKINIGLESGVDLVAFAQRILESSIIYREVLGLAEVASELIKTLLKDPKDLSVKHKDNELLSQEYKLREYELQVLFRMEILQSQYASHVKKSTKQKLVKQTCSFLEFIQCNMEGGFFGVFNLSDYVETLITNRYAETLGDVINQIYERMDLLLFHDEEDEYPNLLLNSEDSNQSLRERPSRENSTSDRTSCPPSSEDSTFPWGASGFGNNITREHMNEPAEETHSRMVDEARERRERARRFSSFTRGVLDLQRVWAPKQSKTKSKSKSKSSGSVLKPSRKSRATRESDDKVCETPESKERRPINNNGGENECTPSRSVYKALFQED